MPRSSLEAFGALWRAYGEGRLGDSLHLVDDQCEITFDDGETTLRGHDSVRAWLAAARDEWKTLTIVYDEVREERPGCVMGVGALTASSVDGTQVHRPIAFTAEFDGGRLMRGRMFSDRDEALHHVRNGR